MQVTETAPGHPEIVRVLAPNPGPMTLEGTNSYLYGSDPCWAIDPGPDEPEHLERLRQEGERRGGIAAVLLTHEHFDHSAGAAALGVPVHRPGDGEVHGGLRALATPGHAAEHVCFVTGDGVCFSGDLILGVGSTYVPPDGGSLSEYMRSLDAVAAEGPSLICPGHGPWIEDPAAKVEEYREHRLKRERDLLAALERGERSKGSLLAEVWADVPDELRPAAAIVMEAHLQKLELEGRVPDDIGE